MGFLFFVSFSFLFFVSGLLDGTKEQLWEAEGTEGVGEGRPWLALAPCC